MLLRHGQSTWNVEGRLQGQTMDVPLTDLGIRQAREAAVAVADLVGEGCALFSSDQTRALQTAAIVGETIGSAVRPTALLREQHLGDIEGKLAHELRAEPVPEGRHISEVRWGEGESVADVHLRCREFLASLPDDLGEVVVVSHGDTLRILLAALRGVGHREVDYEFTFDNGVPVVEVVEEEPSGSGPP